MNGMKRALLFVGSVLALALLASGWLPQKKGTESPYARWEYGPSTSPDFFPIAVWLQHPKNAGRYQDAGFNIQIGLWKGPTEEQLEALAAVGMKVICAQNEVGLAHRDDPTIIGWLQQDEPDNAQRIDGQEGYGPPVLPAEVQARYERMKKADPARPVFLNLGQGVAWDHWIGRGVRRNHPEDYAEYLKGCDVASFDIYPGCHPREEVQGKLWYVARGVERLCEWSRGKRIVWNVIECTRISNLEHRATPHQVRAEAWMSLIHGSTGLVYFVHQFKPTFIEAALLADEEMLAAVTKINAEIHDLAPVLNSPTQPKLASVKSADEEIPVALLAKEHEGDVYLFAVCLRDEPTTATFRVKGLQGSRQIEVLHEKRRIESKSGAFEDRFTPWQVHLYRFRLK